METTRPPVKIPERLDLNEWIELSLNSEDEVSRQIALEELVTTGVPPFLVARIREISGRDQSSVCRQLALWILSLEKARSELKAQIKGLEVTPAVIAEFLAGAEPAKASVITQLLRKAPSEEVLRLWRESVAVEKNPRMLEVGLTLLGKFGCETDAELVPMLLLGGDADVVCAGLTLLQQRDVAAFKKQVRIGLTSRSFRVQLHSVQLLRQVDCDEAIKYIQVFLFHKNALIRQKALREMMLINFDKVENLFLQYLGREVQPLLLVKAGFVAAFNPAAEFPLKIYDIMLLANSLKKHILQLILRQSIESIQAAGILKQGVDEYLVELKQRIAFRRSEQIIRCAVADLASKDSKMRASAIERLSPYAENQSIKAALKKHFAVETVDEVKLLIEPLISDEKLRPATPMTGMPSPKEFAALSVKDQRAAVASVNTAEAYLAGRQALFAILKCDVRKNIVLEILKTIGRFGSRIDSQVVAALVEDKDPSVSAQAVKTLGIIDIDAILPNLNRFLADDDPRIKSAAFEVFLLADKEGAVQYLASMLRAAAIATRRIGLSLLPQLDYPSAEPLLWRLLSHEAHVELQAQAGYMVAANPTREGLFRLFAFTHGKNGEIKPGFEEIWRVGLISAETVFHRQPDDMERECWEAFKADLEDNTPGKSDYSFNSVLGDADTLESMPETPEDTPLEMLFLHLFEFKWIYLIGAVCLTPIIWFLWGSAPPAAIQRENKGETASRVNFISTDLPSSTSKTQVGSSDWKGSLKTGARELLSGKAYSSAISSARTECEQFMDNYEKDFRQHMTELANNPNASEEERMMASANLNSHFYNASRAWEEDNFSEAEMYYEQAANDQGLNSFGKLTALQRLMEICEKKQDKVSWVKWQDRLMKELKSMPGNESIAAFEDFGKTFGKMMELSQSLAAGTSPEGIVESLKAAGETEESARASVETLKNMDENFRSFFNKPQ